MGIIILASWMIIIVHPVEVLVWAGFFLWCGAMPSASLSYFFALMDYTTLGSNYSLPERWRLFGRLYLLIHAAGGAVTGGLLEVTPEAWQGAFDVHVHAVYHLSRTAAKEPQSRSPTSSYCWSRTPT